MATSQINQVIQNLRRTLLQEGGPTDGQLLACFIEHRDEAAFAALVNRHGRLVWNVCRRLLSHHDAEDAFQVTFAVLCHKAASIRRRECVASWLYGVAYQAALQARRASTRRRGRERQVADLPEPAVVERDRWPEVQALLDQELRCLPEHYQAVMVLCDLEGKTRKEAARQLGVPEGTVGSRLTRARLLLARRLARHGVALPAGALALLLAQKAAAAPLPPGVFAATLGIARLLTPGGVSAGVLSVKVTSLTQRVLKAMLLNKLRSTLPLMVFLVLFGAGPAAWLTSGGFSAVPAANASPAIAEPQAKQQAPAQTAARAESLQGVWKAVRCELDGRDVPPWDLKLVIMDARIWVHDAGLRREYGYRLDPTRRPRHIDWIPAFGENQGKAIQGIYQLDDDGLVFCTAGPRDSARPTAFKTQAGRQSFLMVLRREKLPAAPPAGVHEHRASAQGKSRPTLTQQLLEGEQYVEQWERKFRELLAQKTRPRGQWPVDLDEVHDNPAYHNSCTLCHWGKAQAGPAIDNLLARKWGNTVIIRLPRKSDPAGEATFLRRICLDILGRPPTPLELDYYLKDSDPEKSRKIVEKLLRQEGAPFLVVSRKPDGGGGKAMPPSGDGRGRAEVERLWWELFAVPPRAPGLAGSPRPQRDSTVQTLLWMNSPAVQERIDAWGRDLLGRILPAYPEDRGALRQVYWCMLARLPNDREAAQLHAYLRSAGNRTEAFMNILWALVNSAEFQQQR
jgi:RNA polymerase sigma factor (sigma-70 family)